MKESLNTKYKTLIKYLETFKKPLLALSGGFDSSFLAFALSKTKNKAETVTAASPFFSKEEIKRARDISYDFKLKHNILNISEEHFELIENNPKNRCYICKKMIFTKIKEFAVREKFDVIFDGTVYDDLSKFRPGLKALSELNIKSPLAEVKMTKAEIKSIAQKEEIDFAKLPSFSCFATRFPYNEKISKIDLDRIQKGENALRKLGFKQFRIRLHRDIARIEISLEDLSKINESLRIEIVKKLKSLGFKYITLDLEGFRSGSMDL